jgi:hypothetical protein
VVLFRGAGGKILNLSEEILKAGHAMVRIYALEEVETDG